MLKHLTIKNYALIKHLELEPSANLNVITGETGAGKSIMLGALGLLMGNRAETKVLWDENEKCVTEGVFDIKPYKLKSFFSSEDLDYDDQTVIRREISAGGKSRAFINDTPVTLEVMKKLGSMLMDVHSQHETLQLGNQFFQVRLLDAYAENASLTEQYALEWSAYTRARKAFETLSAEASTLRNDADYIQFQLNELMQANLEQGEQEKLESELQIQEHAEEIKTKLQTIATLLNRSEFAVVNGLREVRATIQTIAGYSPAYESLAQRINSMVIELDDLIHEAENEEEGVEFDPQRASFVQERLSLLYRLMKKHQVNSIPELMELQAELERKNAITSNVDEALAQAMTVMHNAEKKVRDIAEKISAARRKAVKPLTHLITVLLQELGIPNAALTVEMLVTEPTPTGVDKVDILFSANKGIAPRPLAQVASGGEFSRLMFCIKYVMAEKTAMPTLILDEIDTGVSGEVAMKLGDLMKSMAKKHQLITITHLPQVAAKGDTHFFVYKDNTAAKTISVIKKLATNERVAEIAKMIGGSSPSKIAIQNAEELLAL